MVSEITEVSQRQVLSWSEKGLVFASVELSGVGTKREYSYINLLEFRLCKQLFDTGMGFRTIKKIVTNLRDEGALVEWALDWENWYGKVSQAEFLAGKVNRVGTVVYGDIEFFKVTCRRQQFNVGIGV